LSKSKHGSFIKRQGKYWEKEGSLVRCFHPILISVGCRCEAECFIVGELVCLQPTLMGFEKTFPSIRARGSAFSAAAAAAHAA